MPSRVRIRMPPKIKWWTDGRIQQYPERSTKTWFFRRPYRSIRMRRSHGRQLRRKTRSIFMRKTTATVRQPVFCRDRRNPTTRLLTTKALLYARQQPLTSGMTILCRKWHRKAAQQSRQKALNSLMWQLRRAPKKKKLRWKKLWLINIRVLSEILSTKRKRLTLQRLRVICRCRDLRFLRRMASCRTAITSMWPWQAAIQMYCSLTAIMRWFIVRFRVKNRRL